MTARSVVQQTLDGMEPAKREAFLRLNPGLRALATQRDAACPPSERAALAAADAKHAQHRATGRAAQASGDDFEAEVFAALDGLALAGVVGWYEHTGPFAKWIDGAPRIVGRALCDVVGVTGDGRGLVAEVKHNGRAVDLSGTARGCVAEHQAKQLAATSLAGGVALLVVCVDGVRAVIPWRALVGVKAVTAEVARRFEARRGLADALRREMGGRDG